MTKPGFISVSADTFSEFVERYPAPLTRHVTTICEPPQVSYNDFRLGNWPESVVARHSFNDLEATVPSYFSVREALPTAEELAAAIHEKQSRDTSKRRATGLLDKDGVVIHEGDRVLAEWGWTMDIGTGKSQPTLREHAVCAINDQHGNFLRWSLSGCYNYIDTFLDRLTVVKATRAKP